MFLFIENVDNTYKLILRNEVERLEEQKRKEYFFSAGFADSYGNHGFITQPD